MTSSPKSEADGGDASLISSIAACVNLQTGEINIDRTFRASKKRIKNDWNHMSTENVFSQALIQWAIGSRINIVTEDK